MPNISELADALTKITAASPKPQPAAPESEPEQPAPTPVLDETTRRARDWCRKMMPHLIYADELTPKQYQRKLREQRKAMQPPPQNSSWLYPKGR